MKYKHTERINPSLVHVRYDRIVDYDGNDIVSVAIPGFSSQWEHGTDNIPLNWGIWAQLPRERSADLEISIGGVTNKHTVTLLPLNAWEMRDGPEFARATAAFVLENSPTVLRFVQAAKCTPADFDPSATPIERAARVYEAFKEAFGLYYLYEYQLYGRPDLNTNEQAIRFPAQVVHDGGGTCIDLALFLAAALLRAGCCPVIGILLVNGRELHAVVGVWQDGWPRREYLPAEGLKNAAKSGELIVLDPNYVTFQGGDFNQACQMGGNEMNEYTAIYGVDVYAVRTQSMTNSLPGPAQTQDGEIVITDMPIRYKDERTKTLAQYAEEMLGEYALMIVASIQPRYKNRWEPLRVPQNPSDVVRPDAVDVPWFRIGRGTPNHFGITDHMVSGDHCAITVRDNDLFLQDLNSRHGTFLHGQRLRPFFPERLRLDDEFWLGESEIVRFKLLRRDQVS